MPPNVLAALLHHPDVLAALRSLADIDLATAMLWWMVSDAVGEAGAVHVVIDELLKKHGWKEGTGLGISEQGRLEPVQAFLKKNKRGLGAEKVQEKPQMVEYSEHPSSNRKNDKVSSGKKAKAISKRMKKLQDLEQRLQEKEFERAFFREFWPDNV
ncbi:hypothetical protein RHSIM_Rhsim05G0152000 [Rhododendron simsii]|uniref:G-patch domain-containing protein n=1 Tax=Rhododendron simsii TaxID=118357 RepID=A0A834GUD8_RHOSS|nr:hypothetical protein RHSIM_Rhsim05G0152000 [Rhododendron simsii]